MLTIRPLTLKIMRCFQTIDLSSLIIIKNHTSPLHNGISFSYFLRTE